MSIKNYFNSFKSAFFKPQIQPLKSEIHPIPIPIQNEQIYGWKSFPIFRGHTKILPFFSCHVSMLANNHIPHPPHKHEEEEILLLLEGEVDLLVENGSNDEAIKRQPLKPGQCVFYPESFTHSLQAKSTEPPKYLMLKWRTGPSKTNSPLSYNYYNLMNTIKVGESKNKLARATIFDGPTSWLKKLHCHVSILLPGEGYEPHIDPYDVILIILDGEVETLGKRVSSNSVVLYKAGNPHGIYNPTNDPAKYIVFEFHGHRALFFDSLIGRRLIQFSKLLLTERLRKTAKSLYIKIYRKPV